SAGDFQIWPTKKDGIWDFPLQMLPYEGHRPLASVRRAPLQGALSRGCSSGKLRGMINRIESSSRR
ncbi:hypothetical protein, partial [Streptomyces bobili]